MTIDGNKTTWRWMALLKLREDAQPTLADGDREYVSVYAPTAFEALKFALSGHNATEVDVHLLARFDHSAAQDIDKMQQLERDNHYVRQLLQDGPRKLQDRISELEREIAAMRSLSSSNLGNAPPIPMRIFCEVCHEIHIDEGEFATKPHHTHACQACGAVWRPAIGPTVGVRFLPGFKNG